MAATQQKTIILITGANTGIGLETTAQLLRDANKHVIIGSRSVEKGQAALSSLSSLNLPGSAEVVQLEVTSPESVSAAAAHVEATHGRLDALVNNAGVAFMPPEMAMNEKMLAAYNTNCVGPVLVTEALGPLLKKATPARIVNVSSGVGSIADKLDPENEIYHQQQVHYRATKAALNMITACHAYEYKQLGGKVFAYDPGFTVSGLSPHNRAENGARPVADAAKAIVRLLNGERDDESGCFVKDDGQVRW